ncbi:cupin-like domain-containing protein [Herbaspirillum sp. alder98]|uniref:cupin-like domain-containing protein n=1 Tax=Herbaspirillum sp. alder98 TaxID=2913096 RepID=UPI001CD8D9B4|nr:cupin-like domain-containing protein [Herbaspirillum sp. alder98]MCA1324927.1 cupin-like domain-containing protein [Herbaspirillum sp. alder98]
MEKPLPPQPRAARLSPEEERLKELARQQRDAQARGVTSIDAMREAIKRSARALDAPTTIARLRAPDAASFAARAAQGLPFIMTGLVGKWPLSTLTPRDLQERFGEVPVRARVGDYINTAFAPDRAMQDMPLKAYLELVEEHDAGLPPYVGNLELRPLNALCHWPGYFRKMGPARFWIGPAGTVTPLHCDYDDNIFAQIWGSKRIILSPPHHHDLLYPTQANGLLFGSPFDPEKPDFERFPLARQALMIECIVAAGEMLYVPAGWYHQVRSLTFSLSANRWARGVPLALGADHAAVARGS